MPNWNQILNEVKKEKDAGAAAFDRVRRRYLKRLYKQTGRNIVVYYSGWLQKDELYRHGFLGFSLDDADKNGFMTTIHRMNRSKGLDLLIHT
ncbi:unnamed protein product, partial [marine sediment metagenome]